MARHKDDDGGETLVSLKCKWGVRVYQAVRWNQRISSTPPKMFANPVMRVERGNIPSCRDTS